MGRGKSNAEYGTEYKFLHESGNIKFVRQKQGSTSAPMITRTKNRIYVTIDNDGDPKYISFYDKDNKRSKQIDLKGRLHIIDGERVLPHTHYGYNHDENGTFRVSEEEQKIIDKVNRIWYDYKRQK